MERSTSTDGPDGPSEGFTLEALFRIKYGAPESTGWAPRRRWRYGYYLPADRYEALVASLANPGGQWLDIGGGHSIFPDNPSLARALVANSARVVAVDPSENVLRNRFVNEAVQSSLEDYHPKTTFDLVTLRMVAEHVEHPKAFVQALRRVVAPGGRVVIFTVSVSAPVTIVSRLLPFKFHHAVKRIFWSGEPEDTFPTFYRMNSRRVLSGLLAEAGLREERWEVLDDLTVFGNRRWLNLLELALWRLLRLFRLQYPEHCLLAVYRRANDSNKEEER